MPPRKKSKQTSKRRNFNFGVMTGGVTLAAFGINDWEVERLQQWVLNSLGPNALNVTTLQMISQNPQPFAEMFNPELYASRERAQQHFFSVSLQQLANNYIRYLAALQQEINANMFAHAQDINTPTVGSLLAGKGYLPYPTFSRS